MIPSKSASILAGVVALVMAISPLALTAAPEDTTISGNKSPQLIFHKCNQFISLEQEKESTSV